MAEAAAIAVTLGIEETSPGSRSAQRLSERLRALPGVRRLSITDSPDGGVVLLFPRHDSAFAEMLPIARLLREARDYLPVFLFATPESRPRIEDCAADGFSYIEIDPVSPQDRVLRGHGTIAGALHIPALRRRLRADRDRLGRLIATLDPFFLGVPGDRELGPGPPLLHAARARNLVSMIVSPAFPSTDSEGKKRAEPRRFRARIVDGAPLINHFVAKRLPKQVCETAFGPRLFTPGWLTLALFQEDMLSERPWHQGGGQSAYLMVHGEEQAERFRRLGCRPEKIKVFGHMEHDLLHDAWRARAALRAELFERHTLEPGRPLVVFAVPSYAEQNLMPMARHLETLEGYGAALRDSGANVVLSLHPKSRPDDYRGFAERHDFVLERERLFRLLPAADLFVSAGSTTIDWAILCGVPVVDIDYAQLNIDLWDDEPAVAQAKTLPAFREALEGALSDPDRLQDLAAIQRDRSARLARFDGKVAERFLAFLDEVHARHRSAREAAP